MANHRNCLLTLLAPLTLTLTLALAPLAQAEDPSGLAPPTTSDVSNEGVPPAAVPAPESAGSLESEPVAEEPVKKVKKKSKKNKKEKKNNKKKSKKKNGKKHGKKKHRRNAD